MPRSIVAAFDDPFLLQSAISTADLELLPTKAGPFRGEMIRVCLNQLWTQRFYQSQPLLAAGSMKPDRRVLAFLTSEKASMRHCGMEILPGDVIVNNSDEIHQRTGTGFRLGSVSMMIGELVRCLQSSHGAGVFGVAGQKYCSTKLRFNVPFAAAP